MTEQVKKEEQGRIEATKSFNDFQSQTRTRIETTVKFILLISGSMLTLSVGAVLSDKPAHISADLLPYLKLAWGALFYSIASGLLLMVLLVITTYHMGLKWVEILKNYPGDGKNKIIKTWRCLEVANWFFGLSGALSCLVGLALIACVAIGVAGNNA